MICGCPQYYEYNPNTGMCERVIEEEATYNKSVPAPPLFTPSIYYQTKGTAIFPVITPSQYPIIAVSTAPPTYVDFLGNTITNSAILLSGDFWISGGKADKGLLNMIGAGMRSSVLPQGYLSCLTVDATTLYSVGVSSVWGFNIYVDGVLAVSYAPAIEVSAYDYFQVIPLQLTQGTHTILIESISGGLQSGSLTSYGGFAFEIYKNITPQILSNITTITQLSDYTAKQYINGIGQNVSSSVLRYSPVDTGEFGNYSCGQGNLIACVEGKVVCRYTDSSAPVPCCFRLTNCSTGTYFFTKTNLVPYLNNFITIAEEEGCFGITVDGTCDTFINVTVANYFPTCADCNKRYYRLVACSGPASDLYTTSDLSEYLNKVIKIRGYGYCWSVFTGVAGKKLTNVEVLSDYDTCQVCN